MRLLLLFDIDGTLVRSRPLTHQRALAAAAVEVFGLPASTDEREIRAVEPWGKTDRWILRDVLGGDPPEGELAAWESAACRVYEQIEQGEPDDSDRRTAAALERLEGAGHLLSLVTGNLEPIARRKLDRRGLGRFFAAGHGGFGSDAFHRADLVRIACERAGSPPAERTVLIGDTPRDVEAALAAGVRCIGVSGERYSAADLTGAGAEAAVAEVAAIEPLLV